MRHQQPNGINKMTNSQYVNQVVKMKNLSISKPTKANPEILIHDWNAKDANGLYKCIVDAKTWLEARVQLNKFYQA